MSVKKSTKFDDKIGKLDSAKIEKLGKERAKKVRGAINKIKADFDKDPELAEKQLDKLIKALEKISADATKVNQTNPNPSVKKASKIEKEIIADVKKEVQAEKVKIKRNWKAEVKALQTKHNLDWNKAQVMWKKANDESKAKAKTKKSSVSEMVAELRANPIYKGKKGAISNKPIDKHAGTQSFKDRDLKKDAKQPAKKIIKRLSPTFGKKGGAKKKYYYEYRWNRMDVNPSGAVKLAEGGTIDREIWSVEMRKDSNSPWEEVAYNLKKKDADKLKSIMTNGKTPYEVSVEIPLPFGKGGEIGWSLWVQKTKSSDWEKVNKKSLTYDEINEMQSDYEKSGVSYHSLVAIIGDAQNPAFGMGGIMLGSLIGGYVGYKVGRAKPQKKGFETEKRVAKAVKKGASDVRKSLKKDKSTASGYAMAKGGVLKDARYVNVDEIIRINMKDGRVIENDWSGRNGKRLMSGLYVSDKPVTVDEDTFQTSLFKDGGKMPKDTVYIKRSDIKSIDIGEDIEEVDETVKGSHLYNGVYFDDEYFQSLVTEAKKQGRFNNPKSSTTPTLNTFKKLAKESKDVSEFMTKVRKIKNVPKEVAQEFMDKYGAGSLTIEGASQKFMDEFGGKKTSGDWEVSIRYEGASKTEYTIEDRNLSQVEAKKIVDKINSSGDKGGFKTHKGRKVRHAIYDVALPFAKGGEVSSPKSNGGWGINLNW